MQPNVKKDRDALRGEGMKLVFLSAALVLLGACSSAVQGSGEEHPRRSRRSSSSGDRSPQAATDALKRAESAFLAGSFGKAVVEANRVMEGAASPDEYYAAVKIVGLASCNRKDARPVTFAFTRMTTTDQDSLKRECALNGLSISDDGKVTVESDQGGERNR